MTVAIGVDPGTSGAAFIRKDDGSIFGIRFKKISNPLIHVWLQNHELTPVYMERVGPWKTDRVEVLAKFMRQAGFLDGCLVNHDVEFVTPSTWQMEMGVAGKQAPAGSARAVEYAAKQRAYKRKAQELFPQIKVTLDMGAAILIAEYGWRKLNDKLTGGKKVVSNRKPRGILRTTRDGWI